MAGISERRFRRSGRTVDAERVLSPRCRSSEAAGHCSAGTAAATVSCGAELGTVIFGEDTVATQQVGATARFDDAIAAQHGDPLAAPHDRQAMGAEKLVRLAIRRSIPAMTGASVATSSAEVGPSRIRIGAARKSARAIVMRCFSPFESATPASPTIVL